MLLQNPLPASLSFLNSHTWILKKVNHGFGHTLTARIYHLSNFIID